MTDRALARFTSKIDYNGPVMKTSLGPCHVWTAGGKPSGYGLFYLDGSMRSAHRVAWMIAYGSLPSDDLELDHLCRNRRCVRPQHLEPVTHRENVMRGDTILARKARQTSCVNGHEFTPENTYRPPRGGTRQCVACRLERNQKRFS